ncbi:MAG: BMP family ABC transporter substrate-binding protein [Oscillospiraceae bacterium]|nr:BMP family ABC transporter substrate-binding protein [Oscillospiraceae bacterium]
MVCKKNISKVFKSNTAAFAAVLLLVSVFLTGCAGRESTQTETQPQATAEATVVVPDVMETEPVVSMKKVAMITDFGSVTDGYVNQACWQGVENWCGSHQIPCIFYEPAEDTEAERLLCVTRAIAEGADTVVLSGYLFGPVLAMVRDVYPDVTFLAIDVAAEDLTLDYTTVYEPGDNMTCLTFREEQIGYLAGYAAVMEGYRKLGFLGAMEVTGVFNTGYGFIQGADAAAKELGVDIEINYAYANQYFGSSALTSVMEKWYQSGIEVVFSCGGGIYSSVIEAAKEYGGKVIGFETDQADLDPCVITSGIKNYQAATEMALQYIRDGRWTELGGKALRLSLTDADCMGLADGSDSWRLENFTVESYRAVKNSMAAGAIRINTGDRAAKPMVSEFTTVQYLNESK